MPTVLNCFGFNSFYMSIYYSPIEQAYRFDVSVILLIETLNPKRVLPLWSPSSLTWYMISAHMVEHQATQACIDNQRSRPVFPPLQTAGERLPATEDAFVLNYVVVLVAAGIREGALHRYLVVRGSRSIHPGLPSEPYVLSRSFP